MGSSNEMNRLVACVAFSGDLKPNAARPLLRWLDRAMRSP